MQEPPTHQPPSTHTAPPPPSTPITRSATEGATASGHGLHRQSSLKVDVPTNSPIASGSGPWPSEDRWIVGARCRSYCRRHLSSRLKTERAKCPKCAANKASHQQLTRTDSGTQGHRRRTLRERGYLLLRSGLGLLNESLFVDGCIITCPQCAVVIPRFILAFTLNPRGNRGS